MFSWKSFLAGISYTLSFGWPVREVYKNIPVKALNEDWRRVSKDLRVGFSKYKAENK